MLTFKVSDLLRESVGETTTTELNVSIADFDPNLKITSPLQGLLSLTHIDDGILVQVTGDISAELGCSRCTENFKIDFPLNFMQEYWEQGKNLEDTENPHISQTSEIDLTSRIQQEIAIQIPIKALCTSLCKGLCPTCGQSLNIKGCECPKDKAKPESPFAKLKDKIK